MPELNTKETCELILAELQQLGSEQTKKTLMKHGAKEPFFGVKVADLKKIQKRYKKQQELAEELYSTGNSDAMYLAGFVCDPQKISKSTLQKWAEEAYWYYLSEYTVAWTAAETPFAWDIAAEWIKHDKEQIVAAGWNTYSSLLALTPNEELPLDLFSKLANRVAKSIHQQQNRVRYTMNGFIIALGGQIPELTEKCKTIGDQIGKVEVNMGGTACKVPPIRAYIEKVEDKNRVGKKRKTAFC